MKIVKFSASNIKKLRAVEITPQGHVVQITGPNGAGKSSILDSIFWALGGSKEISSQPIRQGEEKAFVKLDLGEVIVTRKFSSSGTTLVVEAASGARFPTPQKMLDEICGQLSFDPLAFTRMAPKAQLETLKGLVKLNVDVDALDGLNQKDFEKRTEVNREIARLKAQVSSLVIPDTAKEDLELDESAILKEMEDAAKHNQNWQAEIARRATYMRGLENAKNELAELVSKADELRKKIHSFEQECNQWPQMPEPIALAELRVKAERARQAGEAKRALIARESLTNQLKAQITEADSLTITMSTRLKQKEDAIAQAEMPVKGLTFGDGEVVFNGVPFSQASQAEQLVVSTVIAMALNPKLRVIRIQDGSLLDSHNLELIGKLAEKGDYQVWLETVQSNDPCAIHMEDGSVVGAQAYGAPPPKEEEIKA